MKQKSSMFELVKKTIGYKLIENDIKESKVITSKQNMPDENVFIVNKTTTYKDINLYNGTYYSRYFEWYGEARELFFSKKLSFDMMDHLDDIRLITVEASNKYIHEIPIFEDISIHVQIKLLSIVRSVMSFKVFNSSGILCAEGLQTFIFTDPKGKPIKIPAIIKGRASKYLTRD